jgi:4-amino-4-deoxy-L-arabinose transferase-like glycosyltransferase
MSRYILTVFSVLGAVLLCAVTTASAEGPESTHQFTEQEARDIVVQSFEKVLGRAPDESGLATYTTCLRHDGRDQRWLESVLSDSREGRWLARERKPLSFIGDLARMRAAFSRTHGIALGVALMSLITSVVLWAGRKHQTLAVAFLLAGVLTMRLFNASLDPFLHLWDERFHALVAKNMMGHPLMPTLYEAPVIDEGVNPGWDKGHVWLHKQPLFLWQIAAAFRLFGVNEFALRVPSALLSTLLVFLIYRIGTIAHGQRVGFISGYLAGTWFYLGELVSGYQGIDHNDVAFITYVTASLWAWAEYTIAPRKRWAWAVAIGLCSGMAILTKWMVGLLVFAAWTYYLVTSRRRNAIDEIKHLAIALGVAILVAAPWQVYTMIHFRAEAMHEIAYNSRHFTEIIEGHGGDAWFHLDKLSMLYGRLAPFVILLGAFFLWRDGKRAIVCGLFSSAFAVYAFFSFAQTKLPSYTLVACSSVFLCFAALVEQTLLAVRRSATPKGAIWCVEVLLLMVLGYLNLDLAAVERRHTDINPSNHYRQALTHNKRVFSELADSLPRGTVLFNVKGRHYIEAMFYTGLPAYNFLPTDEQIRELSNAGFTIAVFSGKDGVQALRGRAGVRVLSQRIEGYK